MLLPAYRDRSHHGENVLQTFADGDKPFSTCAKNAVSTHDLDTVRIRHGGCTIKPFGGVVELRNANDWASVYWYRVPDARDELATVVCRMFGFEKFVG